MTDRTAQPSGFSSRGFPFRLRRRVILAFTAVVVVAFLIAAALVFSRAQGERQAIRDRALSAAVALSFGFDQEVMAVNYLLKGLSTSPALLSDDFKAFYDQMKATPVPEGSWLLLQDLEGQIANTLRPFGTPLPRHTEVPNYQEQIERIRQRRWTVSGRLLGPLTKSTVIALSLRIDGADGQMKQWITTILSDKRLSALLDDQKLPSDWTKVLYDRMFQPIVATRAGQGTLDAPAPAGMRSRLADVGPNSAVDGLLEDVDEQGVPILVAYRRSGVTNWTTVVAVPLAVVNAPVTSVAWQLAGPAAFLLLIAGLAALLTTREVERPLETLSHLVTEAKNEVTQLSDQLLALQEEERRRIARELHDSTAQRIVAANLGLFRLEREIRQNPAALKVLNDIGTLLENALTELRIFTYLLHPPNLADDGLYATLRAFIDGFAGRTGLQASVRLSDAIDETSPEIQRSILRVVQEALANAHRHADASHVHVGARLAAGCLVVRVRDDGRGIPPSEKPEGRPRLGVGIPGMHARLQQFGGDLKIRTGPNGTSLLAYVPLAGQATSTAARPRTEPIIRARAAAS
jgi:two-component system, NarL family, sensor kinase